MNDGQLIGLLKFFKDKDKLAALQNGTFWCNTPEYYRLSGDEGIGDSHESCVHAYRKSRVDQSVKLQLNGHEIDGLTALTIHSGGLKDKWLHCWFSLRLPDDEQEMESLVVDIDRMRKEFGSYYAFVPAPNIAKLAKRVQLATKHQLEHGLVRYSCHRIDWSAACKAEDYSYQREYRFLIGESSHTSTDPLIINCAEGLHDLIFSNESLRIEDEERRHVWFHLDTEQCYSARNKA